MEQQVESKLDSFFQIPKHTVNLTKYKRFVRNKFELFSKGSRLLLFPELVLDFRQDQKKVLEIVGKTLERDSSFENGNVYFLFSLFDCHMKFLLRFQKTMLTCEKDLIKEYYGIVKEKNLKLIEILQTNLENPVTLEQLKNAIDQGEKSNECSASNTSEDENTISSSKIDC